MTSFSFDYLSITGQTLSTQEYGVIATGGGISASGNAVYVTGFGAMLVNSGTIFGSNHGIYAINSNLSIQNSGTISGPFVAIYLAINTAATNAFINNSGTIAGMTRGADGIMIESGGNEIINSGNIIGNADDAIQIYSSFGLGTLANRIVNSGMLVGGVGSYALNLNDDTDTVINSGTMIGGASLGGNNDIFTNRNGTVNGDVFLGSGNDTFDNRGGTIDGTVFGDIGNDIFYAGASAETFNGGIGTDTLNVQFTAGGTIDLSGGAAGTGVALGDVYVDIENVSGSLSGNDIIIGSAATNVLYGFGGNDALNGGAGGDFLVGNAGIDTLVGGTGNDNFQYLALSESGDNILDFSNIAGNNDQFRVSAAGFGGGLVAGALNPLFFQSRADNLAQDANDRFIFRTTDQTLWFDVNGNAAGGLTMIADLQAGAVVTATDILIFLIQAVRRRRASTYLLTVQFFICRKQGLQRTLSTCKKRPESTGDRCPNLTPISCKTF